MSRQRTVADFLSHFHSLRGIDPRRTNGHVVTLLFDAYHLQSYRAWTLEPRNSGVTTLLIEFAKWIDVRILVVTRNVERWKSHGISAVTWRSTIKGLKPRPDLVLIDNPLSCEESKSATVCGKFRCTVDRIPYPAIEIYQKD